jgi:hypothetical protein
LTGLEKKKSYEMAWLQTRDILNQTRDFYQRRRVFFEGLDPKDNQRMGLLLDGLRRQVEYLERKIRISESDMTLDDLIGVAVDFDSRLSEFFRGVAESAEFEGVRELFYNFEQSVEAEKRKLAQDASGLKQL